MDDDDDVSGVKPLTIWQQKAVREAHGLELEKADIENDIVEMQKTIDALAPQISVVKEELWEVRKKMGSYPTWVTRGDDIRQLHERALGASDAPAVSQRRIRQRGRNRIDTDHWSQLRCKRLCQALDGSF